MRHGPHVRSCLFAAPMLGVLAACAGDEDIGFQNAVLRVFTEGSGSGTVDFGGVGGSCSEAERGGARFCTSFPDAGGGGSVTVTAIPDAGSVFAAWTGCESTSGPSCIMGFDFTPVTVDATVRFDLEGAANTCADITNIPLRSSLPLKTGPRPGPAPQVPADPSQWTFRNFLVDPDFENEAVFAGGIPTGTGYWAFDEAWSAPAQQGITPQRGSRMLHFVSSSRDGTQMAVGSASEQVQLVDVSQLSGLIDGGAVAVDASAYFNRVATSCDKIDNAFGIRVSAHDAIPTDVNVDLGFGRGDVTADNDAGTWQLATATLMLPAGTRYVAVRIFINEGTENDPVYPEFHGHYADNANLTVRLSL